MTENEIKLRRKVREAVRDGVPAEHLDEVVDLAFHALNSAFAPLAAIARSASTPGAGMCMISIALSMIVSEAQAKLASLEKFAVIRGGRSETVMVGGGND